MAINVEAGVKKRMRLNSQCINQIRISGSHNFEGGVGADADEHPNHGQESEEE